MGPQPGALRGPDLGHGPRAHLPREHVLPGGYVGAGGRGRGQEGTWGHLLLPVHRTWGRDGGILYTRVHTTWME